MTNLRAIRSALAVGLLVLAPAARGQVVDLVPNLKAYPAFGIGLDSGGTRLLFSVMTWNAGAGPLELRAGGTSSSGQNVYQRVYRSDGSYSDRLAGTFTWHPDHAHFHFADYALYTLQPVDAPGASDRISSKTTFCVMDTDHVDASLPGSPGQPFYATCNASTQGMSVGWGDTYVRTLAGQSIDVSGLPEGDYRLLVEVDPRARLVESDDGDNLSCVLLHLRAPSSVTVLNASGCQAVTVSAISPSSGAAGSVFRATITGSGFSPGMAVSFENGAGPRPTASGVSVSADGTTITTTVSIKIRGGGKTTRPWDVRVGPAVLPGAFTVTTR